MDPLPIVVKVQMEGEHLGERVRITAQVEGEGEAARAAAVELPAALAATMAKIVTSPGATPVPAPEARPALAPSAAARIAPAPPASGWVARNRARLNIGFGGVLLAMAMLIPMLVPADQRREVLIMTILFGLTGALLLFTAGLPSRSRGAMRASSQGEPADPSPLAAPASAAPDKPVRMVRASATVISRPSPLKAWSGLAIGVAFVLAGLLAPFALGATTADERFLIMLGFAPISVIGFFLIVIFWRNLPLGAATANSPGAPTTVAHASADGGGPRRRAPVSRVPDNVMYRGLIPVAIAALVVTLAAVVVVLIFAALASTGR